jgi:hypothetical protein
MVSGLELNVWFLGFGFKVWVGCWWASPVNQSRSVAQGRVSTVQVDF